MQPAAVSEHVIRLRGPWTFIFETEQTTETVRQPFTKPLPARWQQTSGHVVAKRKFNSPSGLNALDRVRLVVHSRGLLAEVLLNDEPLQIQEPRGPYLEWTITRLLVPFNELRLCFASQAIEPQSFLPPISQVELRIGPAPN